ncbi:class I SAM-dependent methyltransferase [Petrachloros mirabilis]
MEVGCGEGILLERLASEGEAWGIEPNTAAAVIAMSKGLRVYAQEFSMFRVTYPDARFDVIAFFQVLEHVPHPWEFLSQIKTLLSRSGFIVFSVPNPDRYTVFFEREWWDYPPHHLTRFSKRGLSLLLERAGFEIVCSIDKPTDESDVALAWKFLYKKVPIPRRARQALKWPLRLALKPIAKMCVDRATGQDLYVVARPRMQELGNEGREPPCD